MGLKEEKLQLINDNFQLIKFTDTGHILESSDEIHPLTPGTDIFKELPFLLSFREMLSGLKPNAEITIPCVQSHELGLEKYYDLTFIRHRQEECTLLLSDFTSQYRHSIELQQQRNNHAINLEKEQIRHRQEMEQLLSQADQKFIFLKVDSLLKKFLLEDIHYVEAYGDYVKIVTEQKTHTIYSKLKIMENMLPPGSFMKIHRSYIVNLDKIETLNQNNLQVGNKILPISLTFKDKLFDRISS